MNSLRGGAYHACYFDRICTAQLFHGQLEDRLKQAEARLANFKLRGVYTHGNASGAGCQIVASEGALAAFIELAITGERQRMRRDRDTLPQPFAPGHRL